MSKSDFTPAELSRLNEYLQKADGLEGDALADLNAEYSDIIEKVISLMAGPDGNPENTADLVKYFIATNGKFNVEFTPDGSGFNLQIFGDEKSRNGGQLSPAILDLFNAAYIPLLNGEITNVLYGLSLDEFTKENEFSDIATYEKNGIKFEIEGYNDFIGSLSTSPLKLWDAIIAYFTFSNPYKAKKNINTVVEIPLIEYAKTRGIDLTPKTAETPEMQEKENKKAANKKRAFKRDIERDLDNLAKFRMTARIEHGRARGDYDKISLISPDHAIANDIIQVSIPPKTATYLLKSYIMNYAPQLQRLTDSNPNLYRIARKILLQNSMDNNTAAGTDNTLKVKTLIASTPHIPNIEELLARGQKNWRAKCKAPLEKVLNALLDSGFLLDWYYLDPRTKEEYTTAEAGKLTANSYNNLNVVFFLAENEKKEQRVKEKEAANIAETP